jgi:hypothetical protein
MLSAIVVIGMAVFAIGSVQLVWERDTKRNARRWRST